MPCPRRRGSPRPPPPTTPPPAPLHPESPSRAAARPCGRACAARSCRCHGCSSSSQSYFEPCTHHLHLLLVGEIHLQRRHRDAVRRHGVKISAWSRILGASRGADPIDRLVVARTGSLDHRFGLVALAERRRLDPAE